MDFTATMDQTVKVITGMVILIFMGVLILPFLLAGGDPAGLWVTICTAVFVLVTFIVTWLYRPLGYRIEADRLAIRRQIGDRQFLFNQIREVVVPDPSAMRWSLRVFGSGAFFGYFGKFRNKTFGSMTWYATRMDGFVVIRLHSGETIALTPDDAGFVNRLKANIGLSA